MIRALAVGLLAGSAMIPQHPLGNFTVNRYDGLVAAPHVLRIDHVADGQTAKRGAFVRWAVRG